MSVPVAKKCLETQCLWLSVPSGALPSQTQVWSTHCKSLARGLQGHGLKYFPYLILKILG